MPCHYAICTDPGSLELLRLLILVGMAGLVIGSFEGRIASLVGKKPAQKLASPPGTECPLHKQWVKPLGECSECGWKRPVKPPIDPPNPGQEPPTFD